MAKKKFPIRISEQVQNDFQAEIEERFDNPHGKKGKTVEMLVAAWVRGDISLDNGPEKTAQLDRIEGKIDQLIEQGGIPSESEKKDIEESDSPSWVAEYDPDEYDQTLSKTQLEQIKDHPGFRLNPDHIPDEVPKNSGLHAVPIALSVINYTNEKWSHTDLVDFFEQEYGYSKESVKKNRIYHRVRENLVDNPIGDGVLGSEEAIPTVVNDHVDQLVSTIKRRVEILPTARSYSVYRKWLLGGYGADMADYIIGAREALNEIEELDAEYEFVSVEIDSLEREINAAEAEFVAEVCE